MINSAVVNFVLGVFLQWYCISKYFLNVRYSWLEFNISLLNIM
jgi:hypothetical protein